MRSLGWALIQCHWCPYEKGTFGHIHAQKEDDIQGQGDYSHLQAKKRGLKQIIPSQPSEGSNLNDPLVLETIISVVRNLQAYGTLL